MNSSNYLINVQFLKKKFQLDLMFVTNYYQSNVIALCCSFDFVFSYKLLMFPPSCPDYPACPRNRKGVRYANEKRHLFLKIEPKSTKDIKAIAASVVEIFVCGMLVEGVSPGLSMLGAYSLFLIAVTPSDTLTRRPWGEK